MTHKTIEKKALILSAFVNFIIAAAGFWVYRLTGLQALFLDFFFSLIAFTSSIVAAVISVKSRKRTKNYPDGMFFLEPLYALLKALLILFLLTNSVATTARSAYQYFFHGTGDVMNTGPVLPYTILMVILCFSLGFYNQHQNKKINQLSTILTAEARSNFIDGLQSFGVGVAIVLLYFVDIKGPLGFLHYTGDFFITVTLACISVKEPVKILFSSFIELSNGVTHDRKIRANVQEILARYHSEFPKNIDYRIYKTGTQLKINIIFNEKIAAECYPKILVLKQAIHNELKQKYQQVEVVYSF